VASTVGNSSLGLDPRDLTVFNGELYFTGNDNHGGRGLFVYDPMTHRTSEAISSASYDLTDQYVAAWGDANQRSLAVEDGALFFGATKTGSAGLESVPELWKATESGASLHIAEVLGSGNVSQSGLIPQGLYKY
jgi:hypothetical protein